jgi:hypothetical protein
MMQVLFKMLPVIWRSPISFLTKVDASCHLLSSSGYLFSVVISIFTVPILFLTKEYIDAHYMYLAIAFLFINCFMIWIYYFVAEVGARGWHRQTFVYPILLMMLSIGFSLNGVYAIKEAILKKKSPFIRTPKFNNVISKYILSENNSSPVYKSVALVNIYFILMFYYIFSAHKYMLIPAALFFAPGYFWVMYTRLREKRLFRTITK